MNIIKDLDAQAARDDDFRADQGLDTGAVVQPVVKDLGMKRDAPPDWWLKFYESTSHHDNDCPHGRPYPYCLMRCKVDPCPIHLSGAARNGLDGGV